MRTISLWLSLFILIAVFTPRAPAQDAATQAQLDKITGEIQDVQDAQTEQDKRINALEKKISDLADNLNKPAANNYASADDLKTLAEKVQEIDQKRQEDNEKILKALEALSKGGGFHRPPEDNPTQTPAPAPIDNSQTQNQSQSGPQQGYEYTIAPNNTLSAIAKAYRAQGVKVTVAEILKANPGLNPNALIVGKKIFIPAPQ